VLLGAVLLFTLEPMVGRMLLPHFGGGFHVWTTSLMFFQGALFAAYLYAHGLAPRLGRWHLATLAAPLAFLPLELSTASDDGVSTLLAVLGSRVAIPFFALGTTAIVAQRWALAAGREPYGLYALSNAGSLVALLGYALVVEPLAGLELQRWVWLALYVVYLVAALLAWRALGLRSARTSEPAGSTSSVASAPPERTDAHDALGPAPKWRLAAYWAALSAAPSAFLSAVTNLLALDVGSVSLVWVTPLALYLGSFVWAFASPRPVDASGTRVPGAVRRLWPHVAAVGLFFFAGGDAGGGFIEVAVQLLVLAFVSLAAHAELFRVRPSPARLTLYYLVIAAGGWAGGACVALLAPVASDGLVEYPASLLGLGIVMLVGRRRELRAWLAGRPRGALLASAALLVVIAVKILSAGGGEQGAELERRRSFYGLYRVVRSQRTEGAVRDLVSGGTRHGRQREGDPAPLSYYHPRGPLGDALALVSAPRRVGVVGLGVGAAAGHLGPGESVRFFELDPVVVALARRHFSYLSEARAEVDVVVGDARVSLARDRARYDVLLVDAFSGDAIPTHLLTREALELYVSRTTPRGLVLVHISNRYYDLRAPLAATARSLGLAAAEVSRIDGVALDQDPAQYVAIARRAEALRPLVRDRAWAWSSSRGAHAWTDDHARLVEALVVR
jgi:hypothetical protein